MKLTSLSSLPRANFYNNTGANTQPAFAGMPPMMCPSTGLAEKILPPANTWKANFLTGKTVTPLRFGYGPSQEELNTIQESLNGWEKKPEIVGPKYLTNASTANMLVKLLLLNQPVPGAIIRNIALQKTRTQNIQNLILNQPLRTVDSTVAETEKFLGDLKRKMDTLNSTVLTPQNKFSSEAKTLFNRFVAQTAPVLFVMGFPDSVDYPGEVAQMAVKQALKRDASPAEVLQTAMVGWLHDPKLHPAHSWSNLATHPVIGSAIAQALLQQPQWQAGLTDYLQKTEPGMTPAKFVNGVVEALSTNNDSRFVMENVQLKKFPFHPLSQLGIADVFPKAAEVFRDRFAAPSKGIKPPTVPEELVAKIDRVKLSTDLRAIDFDRFANAMAGKTDNPRLLLNQLLDGQVQDKELVANVRAALKDPQTIINPQVGGKAFLAHHDEVKDAPLAALGIAIADQYFLSAHKILESGREKTAIGRIRSFNGSIIDNLNGLPKAAFADGQRWLRDMYRSILKTADTLTGNTTLLAFDKQSGKAGLADQVKTLNQMVADEKTWQNGPTDYANFDPTDAANADKLKGMLALLKANYTEAAQTSPAMFGPEEFVKDLQVS